MNPDKGNKVEEAEKERSLPGEYGEPWGRGVIERGAICYDGGEGWVFFRLEGGEKKLSDEKADRMIACVNALAGCPDPMAFVEAARKLAKDQAKEWEPLCDFWGQYPDLSWLKPL